MEDDREFNNEYDDFIWTDRRNALRILWSDYEGMKKFYRDFVLSINDKKYKRISYLGFVKYATSFLLDIKYITEQDIKIDMNKKNRADLLLKKMLEAKQLLNEEVHEVADYSEYILFASGLKNIVVKEDKRPGIVRARW